MRAKQGQEVRPLAPLATGQVKAIDRSIVRVIINKPFDVTQLVDTVVGICDGTAMRNA
jgi:hypothetical protein